MKKFCLFLFLSLSISVVSQQKSRKESFSVKGGAQTQEFEIKSDEY